MNWPHIEGQWKQLRGVLRERWGWLTNSDLDIAAGRRDQLIGIVQQRYGTGREEAERQVDAFSRRVQAH